ncbi:PAS domain-containing protein [Natronorubrum sp. FCH18a]|uniref:PAS domain-containing protein n=1 Tax=Natronorubrum sp. FCH18a TaxID=3447018 RepID=UPI003F511396
MDSSDSTSDISPADIRRIFAQFDDPSRPVGAAEVADELACPRETARRTLMTLAERGTLRTRDVDETTRVWWRPSEPKRPDREEFTSFVDAVEEYAIFMLDPDGRVVSWNAGAERIKGYDEDEIVGTHFSTFYTDGDVDDGVPERNLETAAREGDVEDEGWRVREDGSRFWASVTITAIRDDDGRLRGFTKVTRDMTERRENEQQLRQERDLVEQILETVPVSILVSTVDGEVIRANQELLDRLNVGESALSDYDLASWDLYDGDDELIPLEEWPWMRVAETGESVIDYQCQADIPGVGRRWLSINAASIDDSRYGDERIVFSVADITEQKEREHQLRRESEQTEKLLRTAPIAIAVQNADGDTVMANQRAQEALGLSEREFIDEPDDAGEWDLYDADGNPLAPSDTPSARAAGTGVTLRNEEIVIDPPNGDRMQFHLNAAPLFGHDGEVERVIVAGEDITELKDRERQLEQRKTELETELSEILGRITDAFYALDDNWRFTHVNERAEELIDFQNQGLVGEYVWDVFDWVANTRLREEYERAMETQEPTSFEFYYPDPLDSWLEIHAYPSETGLSVYFRDVTERVERERQLEESERRYRTLIEHFPNGAVALVDEELRYQTIGGTPLDEADVTVGSQDGVFVEEALSPPLDDELVPRYEAALEGESDSFEIELGSQVYEFQTVPIRDDDGDVFAALGMSQDITERREYERKLEESNERLEQFAYAASHDLQEPLRMVTSYLQLIEQRYDETLDEDGREFLAFAVDGAERMRDMIDGLLEYSRVETRGDPFEPVDLESVLDDVRNDLQIQIEESGAEITAEPLPRVAGDPSQLRQVVQNLLDNAIEYSGDEPPRVHVTAEPRGREWEISVEPRGREWEISVRDEGIGIDPDDADRIFEVFQRLHSQEEHAGTGIGLALCRRIVERHGGEITVDSEPGEGTTFSVTLPAADGDDE